MRFYIGDVKTDERWRNRWVEVLVRGKGPSPRNALVRFDDGSEVVVATYSGGLGATLRLRDPRT
ncbi:MAG: hypothetical protein M3P11_12905 [Actinomycetota bacterium]|nr:hypothetical protein [Actinomycetota bacterium]MDP9331522.1 hypothetical protein [Actinomycetota bacterium]